MEQNNEVLTPEVVEKAETAVKKRTRPDRSLALKPHLEPGDNTRFLEHSLRFFDLPKVNTNSEEEVLDRTRLYFQACADDDIKPGIVGYANALGITRYELNKLVNEERGNGAAVHTIKKAKSYIEQQMEMYMQNGKLNPVAGIFLMKNNFLDYKDHQEIEIKAVSALGDQVSKEEIAQKYMDALPGDIDDDGK